MQSDAGQEIAAFGTPQRAVPQHHKLVCRPQPAATFPDFVQNRAQTFSDFVQNRAQTLSDFVQVASKVDFLIVRGKRLCPVEVKSSGYKSHKSFDYFTKKYDVKANERFIVYTKNLDRDGDLTYLPLYMAMCL